ncbi:MAG: crossover junction endodeoxyribonuclease RuvC [Candidatus Portnoybacteria bacterium]|nr:crossover junction endodeoxyribonuclease RuvC [Candidatus Portnoybacteria bacterium]
MKVLGIDPGTAIVGFGLIEKNKDGSLKEINHGCIRTSPDFNTSKRLEKVHKELTDLIKKCKPDIIAVEDIFFFKNLKTAIKVSQARGVILLTAEKSKAKIMEFTPLQVKQAVACYGRADKKQVQTMVKALLGLKKIPKPDDAADALAIAICAANNINNRIK